MGMAPARTTRSQAAAKSDDGDYALAVQNGAKKVAETIRSRSMVNSETWAGPLATAPSAVSTMAILLKTSSSKAAAGITIKSRDVKDDGGVTIGELLHDLLHPNLVACSNLGRNAFQEARRTMNYIHTIAIKMTEDKGKIESILRTIDEIEDEDDNLATDIKDVRDSTAKCLAKVQTLTDDFQYWYRVVETLKVNVAACQGEKQKESNINDESRQKTEVEKDKLAARGETTSEVIKELELQLEDAKKKVSEAQAHMKELEDMLPVASEPSLEEEQILAQKAIPIKEGNKVLTSTVEHERDVEKRRADLVKQKIQQRESEKKKAQRILAAARAQGGMLSDKKTKLIADVGRNREKLASAKANLDNAEAQFQRLSEEKLQLVDILAILEESSRQLGDLRAQVEELVGFFHDVLDAVDVAVTEEVEKELLTPIQNKLLFNKQGAYQGVKIGKEKIHASAVKIQGNFCAIREIAGVYVVVSDRYILPAIKKMGSLADASDEDWPVQRDEFTSWCRESMAQIEGLTQAANDSMVDHMTERVKHLHLAIPLAVEAAR
ncbi:hypothetical protein B0T16DRAFT_383877 [Cercophora newfieldiana]|uniref:Uncharacterized protein n=1 Tax=Cercophora newfieldiana TaxID=92897 RepID=A0AA39YNJ8_9PEZI|nr:hypothetical protein B0T16DRAFT_383877 [Cercophora newfieldiana]